MQHESIARTARDETRRGLSYGLAAYLLWGLFPIYFKALGGVPAGEVLAHRILWSLAVVAILIAVTGRAAAVWAAVRNPRVMLTLAATATLIAVNWLVYIEAVTNGQMLAGSLGYYLNPLVSVGLGVVVLYERLTRAQLGAIGLALAGVAVLAFGAGTDLWISLTLAVSFSVYGLLRKMAPVDPLTGLALETTILVPIAAAYLIWREASGIASFGEIGRTDVLLAISGVITAAPLLLFSAAAKRLRYSTIGVLQFIAPTLQFGLAVFVYGEALTQAHIICFAAIWTAVVVYVADALRQARTDARAKAPATGS